MNEYLVGIDIGSSKVCAVAGKMDKFRGLEITGTASRVCSGLKKSLVVDIEAASEAIRECKYQLEAVTDMEFDEVYISIPGGLCELVPTKGVVAITSDNSEVKDRDVERVIEAAKSISISPDRQIIGLIPEKYSLDGYDDIKDPVGMSGSRLEVDARLVLIQSTVINNIIRSFEAAGLKIKGIILQPQAQAALLDDDRDINCAFIDVGADSIDICIFREGNPSYTGLIPLGGNSITNDISQCLKIPFDEAERLKHMHGAVIISEEYAEETIKFISSYHENINVSRELLSGVINARAEEMLSFVLEELKVSGDYSKIDRIYLTGGGLCLFSKIEEFAGGILERPVKVLAPQYVGASNPIYATAAGIVKTASISQGESSGREEQSSYSRRTRTERNAKGNNLITRIKGLLNEFF